MTIRLKYWWDLVRTSYWFLPCLMCLAATLLAVLMVAMDQTFDGTEWLGWAYSGGAEGARGMLSTIAGSMVTVAGVVFSITIVALTLASSQFGPRLLRNFMRDRVNQFVLGTFTSTFLYCLIVLRTVKGLKDSTFVPELAVTTGFLMAVLSLIVLIFYIHHIAISIRVTTLITEVANEMRHAIDYLYPERFGEGKPEVQEEELPSLCLQESTTVAAQKNGYLVAINHDDLMELAVKKELIIHLQKHPGHFVVRGDCLAEVWGEGAVPADLVDQANAAFVVDSERTSIQDIEFSVDQLVEIAVRALSPGINDPFTAINCVDRLGQGLCHLAERRLPDAYRHDEKGKLRVIAKPIPFPRVLKAGVQQIRQYGSQAASVLTRLLEMLLQVAPHTRRPEDREALTHEGELVLRAAQRSLPEEADVKDVQRRFDELTQAIQSLK